MPNHFHFLLKQLESPTQQNNITNFMRRLSITYAMYFSHKHDHSGGLFQGKYKNVTITSQNYLLYLTKYIHQNPQEINQDISSYPFSSHQYYLKPDASPPWLHPQEIITHFSITNPNLTYQSFVEDHQTILPKELRLD